jgi:hypothetical protein
VRLTGTTGRAAEDPSATAAPTDPAAPETPAPDPAAPDTAAPDTAAPDTAAPNTAAPGSTPTPAGTGAVDLPSSITGQTAAQQTCTKGND